MARQWISPFGIIVDEDGEEEYILPFGGVLGEDQAVVPSGGRIMSSLAASGGLAGMGGIAGRGGGLAG